MLGITLTLPYKLYKAGNTDKATELLDDVALNKELKQMIHFGKVVQLITFRIIFRFI